MITYVKSDRARSLSRSVCENGRRQVSRFIADPSRGERREKEGETTACALLPLRRPVTRSDEGREVSDENPVVTLVVL